MCSLCTEHINCKMQANLPYVAVLLDSNKDECLLWDIVILNQCKYLLFWSLLHANPGLRAVPAFTFLHVCLSYAPKVHLFGQALGMFTLPPQLTSCYDCFHALNFLPRAQHARVCAVQMICFSPLQLREMGWPTLKLRSV